MLLGEQHPRLQRLKLVASGLTALYLLSAPQVKSMQCLGLGMRMCCFPQRLRHPRPAKSAEGYFQSKQNSAVIVATLRKIHYNLRNQHGCALDTIHYSRMIYIQPYCNTNSDLLHQLVEYLVIHQWSLPFQNLLSVRNNHYTSKHYLHNDRPLLDQLSLLLVPMSQPH